MTRRSRWPTSTSARTRFRRRSGTPGISPELDAVVLKALAKNPDNRYQTAAEMRADLVRVHSGEAPEAPKVLTDADRTSLMAVRRVRSAGRHATEPLPVSSSRTTTRDRGPVRSAAG